ncbi:hypothetical protein Leryth_019968 [Lithospermum erythrorhizon]|nr:hypothetical protein Leryth_019968 [Lithospermum erythrorhizon]
MSLLVEKTASGREYKVKDMTQADFGRLEIELAEVEMPGLMACRRRRECGRITWKSTRIGGQRSDRDTTRWVFEVRWCSCDILRAEDKSLAACRCEWLRCSLERVRPPGWCTICVVDDGECPSLSSMRVLSGSMPKEWCVHVQSTTDNTSLIVLTIIRDGLKSNPLSTQDEGPGMVGVFTRDYS